MVAEVGTTPAIMASAGLNMSALTCVAVLDGSPLDVEAIFNNPPSAATLATMQRVYGTDPAVWAAASAMNNARNGNTARHFFVVLRTTQTAFQTQFAATLRSVGVSVTTVNASSIGHGQVINNIGAATDTVMTAPMLSFLNECR